MVGLLGCARSGAPEFTSDGAVDVAADLASDVDAADVAADATVDLAPLDVQPVDRPRDVAPDEEELADVAMDAPTDGSTDASDAAPVRRVDHCYIVEPPVQEVVVGARATAVAAHVFVAGVTSGAGQGAGVTVEIGSGPGGSDPTVSGAWRFATGAYERDVDGAGATGSRDYDRYSATPPTPEMPGEYAYAARARVGTGPWTACDLVATTPHTYAPAFAGRMTVVLASAPRVAFCNLQFPRALMGMSGAAVAAPVFGRVFAAGVTDRGCTDRPTSAVLAAQVGVGPQGSYPSDAAWTWTDGTIEGHRDSNNPVGEGDCHNLEYRGSVRAPMLCGPHAVAWRFRRESGPWVYCRWAPPAMDAPTTPAWNVYDPTLAGTLTVTGCL